MHCCTVLPSARMPCSSPAANVHAGAELHGDDNVRLVVWFDD